jgi:hypothetical protein
VRITTCPFRCSPCGLADEPDPVAFDVCANCLATAADRMRTGLGEERPPADFPPLMDNRLQADTGASAGLTCRPDC